MRQLKGLLLETQNFYWIHQQILYDLSIVIVFSHSQLHRVTPGTVFAWPLLTEQLNKDNWGLKTLLHGTSMVVFEESESIIILLFQLFFSADPGIPWSTFRTIRLPPCPWCKHCKVHSWHEKLIWRCSERLWDSCCICSEYEFGSRPSERHSGGPLWWPKESSYTQMTNSFAHAKVNVLYVYNIHNIKDLDCVGGKHTSYLMEVNI